MTDIARLLIVLLSLPAVATISYWLARAGEPQSLWLWRDVLGVLH